MAEKEPSKQPAPDELEQRQSALKALHEFSNVIISNSRERPRDNTRPSGPMVSESATQLNPTPLSLRQNGLPNGGGGGNPQSTPALPSQFSIVQSVNSGGDLLLGVFNHSPILNTGKPNDILTPAKLLTSLTPTPSDAGFFAFTSFPACLYLKCNCGPYSGWSSNAFFTGTPATTIAQNTASKDLPGGGMFEITYSAGPPVVATPSIARLLLCTVYAADDIVVENLSQIIVKTGVVVGLDSSASNATATLFAFPGSP